MDIPPLPSAETVTTRRRAYASAIEAAGTVDFWPRLKETLATFMRFDELVVLVVEGARAPRCPFSSLSKERHEIWVAEYQSGPYMLDPFYKIIRDTERSGAVPLRTIAPDDFRFGPYFTEYYATTGIQDELGFIVRLEDGRTLLVSLLRTESGSRFGFKDQAEAEHCFGMVEALVASHVRWCPNAHAPKDRLEVDDIANMFAEMREGLTSREVEVATMILQGHSSLSVAANLGIAEGTVKIHRKNLYRKLRISSQAELFSIFVRRLLEAA